jgi:hypothetical protein
MTGWCVAFINLSDIQAALLFLLHLFLGVVAGFLTWLISGPLLPLLYRLALRRPAPRLPLTAGRLTLAVVVGVLVFLLPLGGLGWGWGPGEGGGPGFGPGLGGPPRASTEGSTAAEKDQGKKTAKATAKTPKEAAKEVLRVEIVQASQYKGGERYYLIDGKEPAKTLAEVEDVLKKGEGRWRQLQIITTEHSTAARGGAPVRDLQNLANRYRLPSLEPEPSPKKIRTPPEEKG